MRPLAKVQEDVMAVAASSENRPFGRAAPTVRSDDPATHSVERRGVGITWQPLEQRATVTPRPLVDGEPMVRRLAVGIAASGASAVGQLERQEAALAS